MSSYRYQYIHKNLGSNAIEFNLRIPPHRCTDYKKKKKNSTVKKPHRHYLIQMIKVNIISVGTN